jgi:hypothetical protein
MHVDRATLTSADRKKATVSAAAKPRALQSWHENASTKESLNDGSLDYAEQALALSGVVTRLAGNSVFAGLGRADFRPVTDEIGVIRIPKGAPMRAGQPRQRTGEQRSVCASGAPSRR